MNCLYCLKEIQPATSWRTVFLLKKPKPICEGCHEQFTMIKGSLCPKCGKIEEGGQVCQDCLQWEARPGFQGTFLQNRSIYQYNDFMKEVLSRFKFRGDAILANMFHDPLNEARKRYFPESAYVTLPIPLSPERLYERGFNQALLLSEQLHLPMIEPLQKYDIKKQSKKSRNERIHAKNMFTLTKPELVKNRDILIIDDIYTTGTTIRHAAKLLHQAGASSVQSLTLIRS